MKVYKIKRRTDNLYSNGGERPEFTKVGKLWVNKGSLKNHLSNVRNIARYKDCEIITYELNEKGKEQDAIEIIRKRLLKEFY